MSAPGPIAGDGCMTHLLGTDEAGYGPNLGPLVISGSLWRTRASIGIDTLYDRVPTIQAAQAPGKRDCPGLVIGDSKSLYKPGAGLAALERMALAALLLVEGRVGGRTALPTWRDMLTRCDPSCAQRLSDLPWYASFDRPLPVDAAVDDVWETQEQLSAALRAGELQLIAISSQVVCAPSFNDRVAACGNKATALSYWTLELVRRMLAPVAAGGIEVRCDKHGGRHRYGALLQQVFPEYLVEVRGESPAQSVYRWGPESRRIEARFVARGERYLPTALASMVSKYLRELAMLAFNEFWVRHLPGLRPTAGYPVDARRFRQEIGAVQQTLGIADRLLWRDR